MEFKARRKHLKLLEKSGSLLLELFIPPVCQLCPEIRWADIPLCRKCLSGINRIEAPVCQKCGLGVCGCGEDPGGELDSSRFLFTLTPVLASVIHGFKYRHRPRNIRFLGAYMRYRPDLIPYIRGFDALIPVPLHPLRRRERGYNQSEILAKVLAQSHDISMQASWLKRVRYTGTQTKLGKDSRQTNLQDAFVCSHPDSVTGKRILLVDDVYTTGATARQCAAILKASGAREVGLFALASVVRSGAKGLSPEDVEILAPFVL